MPGGALNVCLKSRSLLSAQRSYLVDGALFKWGGQNLKGVSRCYKKLEGWQDSATILRKIVCTPKVQNTLNILKFSNISGEEGLPI